MMQGVGKTMTPFVFNLVGMWGIRIVGTFLFTQLLPFGLVAAWACMIAHNLFLFAVFVYLLRSGRWNPLHQPLVR
jgi:Na+-driven multidrug efflux pump